MVSTELTEIERGEVQWKPDPKERLGGKDGSWTSYQIKVNDTYFDCTEKVYNTVRENEGIEFTYTTREFQRKDGSDGKAYKISDLIGPASAPSGAPTAPQSNASPAPKRLHSGWQEPTHIGDLPGAEFGMIFKEAIQECQRVANGGGKEPMDPILYDDLLEQSFMQFLRVSLKLKSQPMPALDPVPLQDDPPVSSQQGPPWGDDEGPDPDESQV